VAWLRRLVAGAGSVRGGANDICVGGQSGNGTGAQSIHENRLLALSFLPDVLFDLSKCYTCDKRMRNKN
jgi:hypothetical protein